MNIPGGTPGIATEGPEMSVRDYVLALIILGVVSGHITHTMVTGLVFDGLRRRVRDLGEARGGKWALFSEGFHCQLGSGVWYSAVISLWLTAAIYVLRPTVWTGIAGHPLGRIEWLAWPSLITAQAFFIAAVGHLFRELVGLVEDHRTRAEGEAEILGKTIRRMDGDQPTD